MKNDLQTKIMALLGKAGKRGASLFELERSCRVRNSVGLKNCLAGLLENGLAIKTNGRYYLPESIGLYQAEIVRNCPKFCFAKRMSDDAQIFIPGKYSKGAVVGDMVFLSPLQRLGESEEGMVISIYRQGDLTFTGVLLYEKRQFFVQPDKLCKEPLKVISRSVQGAKPGDKVTARIFKRGDRHSEHICEILNDHGSSDSAAGCARALVEASGAPTVFARTLELEAERIADLKITDAERAKRLDLTDLPIFTIDSAESKDLDDAVSIEKKDTHYLVGVHIADVSHYIRYRSALDVEAYSRGTSIYYANHVVPMLPKAISNGICSLNPSVERLAFSAIMKVSFDGELLDFDFRKTIIRSRVKGVYKEINKILDKTASQPLLDKYKEVLTSIYLMHELYKILLDCKIKRGAPQLVTSESKIIVDENEKTVDIQPRVQGISEGMIEEFMLLANEAAATIAIKKQLPFVYRVHEYPSEEKMASLKEMIDRLGLPSKELVPKAPPSALAKLLEKSKGTELFPIVNMQTLRSMAKAKYSANPIGHYGLAIKNYCHFTSPIRRYPDLTVHRILSDYVYRREDPQKIRRRYNKFVLGASINSTETEKRAMMIERDSSDCYKAEYMKSRVGESFEGIITSIISRGMFVSLPNTVEGYVKIESLPGNYEYDGFTKLKDTATGHGYRIGQTVRVVCVAADVNSGNVDFEIEKSR